MSLTPFQFESKIVRTIDVNGEIAFSLSDSLKAIDSNTGVDKAEKSIIEGLGDEWVIKRPILDSLGRVQEMTFVFEAGLTFIISRSRTEVGKRFNRWLHTEVLPSIRKTGQYNIKQERKRIEPQEAIVLTEKVVNFKGEIPEAMRQVLMDNLADALLTQKLESTQPRLIGVAQRAEELGYPVDHHNRSHLGKFVKSQGLKPQQEQRLCNGQLRKINLYEQNNELDTAIANYFER